MHPLTPDQPNHRLMSHFNPLPPLEELQKLFVYDPDSGLFTNKTTRGKALKGQQAGSTNGKGYLRLRFKGKQYVVHRVAWLFMTGHDPGSQEVDHIDQNRLNNRWENLRLANRLQNRVNSSRKGWTRSRSKYQAQITIAGVSHKLGCYATPEEAARVFQKKHIELYGEFSPYLTQPSYG